MNWFKNPFRNKTGVYECDACNGTGTVKSKILNCQKCHGTGKLDWVEKIVGKQVPDLNHFHLKGVVATNHKLMVLNLNLQQKLSFKEFLMYLKGFDIFIETGKFSIPFLKTIVLLNMVIWLILYFGVK